MAIKFNVFILFFLLPFWLFAQKPLFVFNTKGQIYNSQNVAVKKGEAISESDKLRLNANASLVCMDSNGAVYYLNKKGTYSYKEILKNRQKGNSGISFSYFKYLWNEFFDVQDKKPLIAGVFRGDILMEYPADSTIVSCKNLRLKWKSEADTKDYYLFLKAKDSEEEFVRYFVSNTSYVLTDQLAEGSTYYWAVSTNPYPNLKNIPVHSFYTISEASFKMENKKLDNLKKDLFNIGLSVYEVREIICKTYKYCE